MSKVSPVKAYSPTETVFSLIEISSLDTLYRDLYLQRARQMLEPILSFASYMHIKESVASVGLIERQLRAAVQRGDWERTTELTARLRAIQKSAEKREVVDLGEAVYDKLADIPLDPFAPGFYAFFGGTAERLTELKKQAIGVLSALAVVDQPYREFYLRRRMDFEGLRIEVETEQKAEASSTVDLHQVALNAVDSGDLAQLDNVLRQLKEKSETKETAKEVDLKLAETTDLGEDLLYTFSEETLDAVAKYGLAPARTRSRRQFAYLLPYGWQPSFLQRESKQWAKDQMSHLTHPFASADSQREAIELYLFNPFINSGGTRFQVCMVVEDLLIEDFPEPEPRAHMPRSALMDELDLTNRWELSRIDIENALHLNGPRIVKEKLHLDPEVFRLVAVPPDIYTNLGPDLGWGQQEMWTHFDGYWIQEGGKLQALGGGDKRFGGTHDVVGFSPNYTSDKVLARFAVVQRKRMMSWHRR